MHSAVAQADGARAAGKTVRREPVESVHPIVRVHPVTGWKSIYVNPGEQRFRPAAHAQGPFSAYEQPD